jgi:hypothetical protein
MLCGVIVPGLRLQQHSTWQAARGEGPPIKISGIVPLLSIFIHFFFLFNRLSVKREATFIRVANAVTELLRMR